MPDTGTRHFYRKEDLKTVVSLSLLILACGAFCVYWTQRPPDEPSPFPNSIFHRFVPADKIHIDGDRKYLWAQGPIDPDDSGSQWFDLSGSPLPLKEFQYGIGRDKIPSIDAPVFVGPDDSRLADYWRKQGLPDINKLQVIGYAHNGIARAYPVALLNRHELVNDTVGGKPVTVGW